MRELWLDSSTIRVARRIRQMKWTVLVRVPRENAGFFLLGSGKQKSRGRVCNDGFQSFKVELKF